ncbi:MAG: pseudouridine synthase [Bacteroidia bacterium]
MRRENPKRKRISSGRRSSPAPFERKNFRRRDNESENESSSGESKKTTWQKRDSAREDRKPFRSRPFKSYDKKSTGEFERKKYEPVPFEKKKKYADRNAKIKKNERRFDFGQEFTNKDYQPKEERLAGRSETKSTIWKKSNTFRKNRNEESSTGEYRKPFFEKRRSKPGFNKTNFRKPSPEGQSSEPGLIRLNKYISNSGICSRREADDMITAGLISVNGKIITQLGTKISPEDVVKYDNETLKRERNVYVLLNKPKDYITTADDPEKRNTVMELVADACKERIYPVGRLDRNTTGVLLFTNDGELTKKLTHPGSNIKKIYHVELDKNLKADDMQKISDGIELEDGMAYVDEIAYDNPVDKSHAGIELHSGKNRIVRRIFEALGYEVRKLDRVVFAGLTKKDLPRGKWRFLSEREVGILKMLSGNKKSFLAKTTQVK